jgi:hypothetical protein
MKEWRKKTKSNKSGMARFGLIPEGYQLGKTRHGGPTLRVLKAVDRGSGPQALQLDPISSRS